MKPKNVEEAVAAVERLTNLFTDVEIENSEDILHDPMFALANVDLAIELSEHLEEIEDSADIKIAVQGLSELEAAGGNPQQAGWLNWDDISQKWDDEKDV